MDSCRRRSTEQTQEEGPAQAHIQALNLTEGMCAPADAKFLEEVLMRRAGTHGFLVVSRFSLFLFHPRTVELHRKAEARYSTTGVPGGSVSLAFQTLSHAGYTNSVLEVCTPHT